MRQMLLHSTGHERKHVAVLLPAGLDHRQQRLDELAAGRALCAERQFPPDHRVTQGPLGRVVGRLDPLVLQEGPQPLAVPVEFATHFGRARVAAVEPTLQKVLDLAARCSQRRFEVGTGDRPGPGSSPPHGRTITTIIGRTVRWVTWPQRSSRPAVRLPFRSSLRLRLRELLHSSRTAFPNPNSHNPWYRK